MSTLLQILYAWIFKKPSGRGPTDEKLKKSLKYDSIQPFESLALSFGRWIYGHEWLLKGLQETLSASMLMGLTFDLGTENGGGRWFWEQGRLQSGQRYFFIKHNSAKGWLVEETGTGWLVSMAIKVPAEDTFLRSYEPVEEARLQEVQTPFARPRVLTQNDGEVALPLPIYARKLRRFFEETSDRLEAS